ncbi:VWA domain-containing protein [Myxococcota bacterium]|nr:VWA domain-containing protein [Myxococcota bacterium]
MKLYRYSRWDGTQEEFSLDPDRALEALSDHMMEGMSAAEALEWMRRAGFQLGGLDMRVMGLEELLDELRGRIQNLQEQWTLAESMSEWHERLESILSQEQSYLEGSHGHDSARMNDFLGRRHRDVHGVSGAISAFDDYVFEDEEAGEDFESLRQELERMRALESFLEREGQSFQGPERADYETAQQIRDQVEALQKMMSDLQDGDFESVSPDALREMLGDPAAQSFVLLRDLEQRMTEAGLLRDGGLTPKAIRKIGASALADVYGALRKSLSGEHDTPGFGAGLPRPDETRPWQFGDALDLDVVKTVLNGIKRREAEASEPRTQRVQLQVEDFEVRELDFTTQATTILLLDMSWSMSWADRFPAAKRVAMAMDQLIRTRYPRDHFSVVGFSTRARELSIRELPEVCWDMGDPFTNLQEGLILAEQLIRRHRSATPQILVITDGQPTAYFDAGQLRVEWPMGMGGVSPHAVAETLKTVRRVTQKGITINTFMLDDAPELVGFVERMTQINKGRAFYTHPRQLSSFLMVDYIGQKRTRRNG